MKSTKSIIAIALMSLTATVATSAFAQNTRAEVQADLQAYEQSGLAAYDHGDLLPDTNSPDYQAALKRYDQLRGIKPVTKTVTRAEVVSDLKAYQESGLAALNRGDVTPNTNSQAYQAAEQRYAQLRGLDQSTPKVTRAEVEADLKAYQESGLQDMNVGNREVDDFSPEYQQAVAKYNALRSHS